MAIRHLTLLLILFLLIASSTQAQISRPYEPIIITGDTLANFNNCALENLYLFSYNSISDTWRLIPFQFDEINPAYQNARSEIQDSIKYFVPEDSLFGLLDSDDELVFMAADLGDQANTDSWVEETDSNRIEIAFFDSTDNTSGYVYLYFSQSLDETVPSYDELDYDSQNDRISSLNYEIGFNNTGQLSDVKIKETIGGSNEDIFDRIKIRVFLSFLWNFLAADEDSVVSNSVQVKAGPVRIIRNMSGSFIYRFPIFPINEKFIQNSLFYPWNSAFKLVNIPIGNLTGIGIEVDEFRVSWDFNDNSPGMNFYSEFNLGGIPIDGSKDSFNSTIQPGNLNWSMGAGAQGSLLNIFYVPPFGDFINLYYFEATDGSSGDSSIFSYDTGDMKSYGDNGFSLLNNIENSVTTDTKFDFQYYNFFLPPNFSPENASQICEKLKSPLGVITKTQLFTGGTNVTIEQLMKPGGFSLVQNYPNPFNNFTIIKFKLSDSKTVNLRIYNPMGRRVRTLISKTLNAGEHQLSWDGKNDYGTQLSSGIYFFRLETETASVSRKLILIK
ncbi:hypothetical protein B6I21_07150 [candidate division KSB1 bacterium 4572_119]|nr:MAG: hypothetical protein B6I21_07150 [candidate division KSB1 bacterium 4572_119]